MPTHAWKGFIHSWHTLGIVLKWMCITVVGIPVAIVTCIVVAAAVLAFAAAVLAVAAGVCAGIFYTLRGLLWVILRIPFWISEFRIHRAERRVFRLPVSQPRTMQQIRPQRGWRAGILPRYPARRLAPVAMIVQPPPVHLTPATSEETGAAPATDLPGAIECQVCLEKKLPDEYPARQPTEICDHPIACCKLCLSRTIETAFQGRIWDDIRCPICDLQFQHQDVVEHASSEVFEKYDTLATRRALQSNPSFRWCLGPNCNYGEEHPEDPKQPMITCTSCGFNACFYHEISWHEGMTCDEYNVKAAAGALKSEKKSEKIIKKIAKRCPGCQRFINKNGGCSHMSCPCGRHFCWSCLHDYPGHTWTCKERL